ncbi:unnamed protein product [Prorocentrum cordatum]|uniref:Uncharacterized protein n=1 Tax=Prorocentrum cordatum TaxID=2364126 RepID=A0ABN9RHY2_9DINO|nr:unnamed protein product [Polarella glacialis]
MRRRVERGPAAARRPPSQATPATFCGSRRASASPPAPAFQAADVVEARAAAPCTRSGMRPRPPSPRIKGLVDKFEGGPRFGAAAGRAPAPVAFLGCASPLREASRRGA